MKKLVFMFVAVAAISFASCNENKAAQEPAQEDTTAVADTAAADTAAADTATAEVADTANVK
jgi:predicted small secreted protein